MLKTISILALTLGAAAAQATTLSCKTRAGHETFVFNEDVTSATVDGKTEMISDATICGEPASQDCSTNELKDSRIHMKNMHCDESDSHAEFIYSLVNGNGRFECRAGRVQKLIEFYDCR
jgi:hypothetical protein